MANERAQRVGLDFLNTNKIINHPPSTAAGEVVVHEQLAAAVEGLAWKDNVRVSTQSNINLSSPGTSIDGITLTLNDRVLVRAQTAASENGIYIFNGSGSAMTRAADGSTADELESAIVTVDEGTDAGGSFRQTQVNFTLGSGDVVWTSFGSGVAQASETIAGKAEIATQTETNTGTDDQRFVTPLKLANWTGRARSHTATFGDGSATQYDFTHNFGTTQVIVQIWDEATGIREDWLVRTTDTNTVRVNGAPAPASNSKRILILAKG